MMTHKTPLSIRLFTQACMRHLCMAFALPIFLIIGCNDTKSLATPPEPQAIVKVVTYSYVAQPDTIISERIVFDNSTDVFKFKNPTIIGDFLTLSDGMLTAIEGKPFPIGFHSYTVLSEDALITLTIQFEMQFTLDELRIYNYLQEIDSPSLILPDLTTDSAPLQILYDSDYSGADFERRFYLRAEDSIRGVFATLNATETDIAFLTCYTAEDGVVPTSFDLFECNSATTYDLSPYAPKIKTVDLTAIAAPDLAIAKPLLFDNVADILKFNNPTIINDFLILQDGVITSIDGAPLPIGTNTYTLHANDLSIMVYINVTLTLTPQAQDIFDILKNSTNPSIALSDSTLDLSDQEIQYDSAFTGDYPNARFFFRVDSQLRGITVTVDSAFNKTTLVCYTKQSREFPESFAVFDCDSATTHDMGTLCVAGGDFVTTIFAGGSGIAGNGSDLFNNAADADKLECFRKAYLLDMLPNPAPDTSDDAAFLDILPNDLTYAKSQYRLVYHDEFNRPDTVGPYDLDTVLGPEWDTHYGDYWPSDPSDYQYKPWRWPIAIKDNKLQIGIARYPSLDFHAAVNNLNLTCTDNGNGTVTFYNPVQLNSWTAPTCECTEHDWSQNSCLGGARGKAFITHQYQYGYLEFHVQTNTNGFVHPHSGIDFVIGTPQLFSLSASSVAYKVHKISGAPPFLAKSTLKDELLNYGVEMQFFENKVNSTDIPIIGGYPFYENDALYPASGVAWFVFHYGRAPVLINSRFYHSWYHTRPVSRKYGFEWTPQGYRIWFDGVRQNPQTSSEFAKYALGLCNSGKLGGGGADDYIQCGISHTARPIFGISGGSLYNLVAQDPDYNKIDYIRLYKPINNYSDMDPLYQ